MARFVPEMNERLLLKSSFMMPQGGVKIQIPVSAPLYLTSRRVVYEDFGKWAFLRSQMGLLPMLLMKGRLREMPLGSLRISRGRYGRNSKMTLLKSTDGGEALLGGFDKTVKRLRDALLDGGIGLVELAPEEWEVRA
jgi:hypothetical protein